MAELSEIERRIDMLRGDYPLYAQTVLKIRDKAGTFPHLEFNSAQELLHAAIEDQKRRKGWVRLLILKGRQQGASTYTGGRFYHRAAMNKGVRVYILSHKQDTSDILFGMVETFHKHDPFAPHLGADSAREMEFDRLQSSYTVATAGAEAGGRGGAITCFHGSEVAFWPNAAKHFAASVQQVPDLPGTEVILESTANGPSGEYYDRWQKAVAGEGDYEAVFISWLLQKEYAREVPEGFKLHSENMHGSMFPETEYMEMFDATMEQMVWRRNKIIELGSAVTFDIEYPATAEVAFQQKVEGAYQDAADILRARKRKGIEPLGPLIMGVDPAGEGGDRFAIAYRRGYSCYKIEWRNKLTTPDAVAWLEATILEADPAVVFIDAGGIGQSVISLLRTKGPRFGYDFVRAVNFGAPSQQKRAYPKKPGPINRRAEMAKRVKEWLALEEGVSVPDMDVLQADLVETKIKPHPANDLQLESKQDIRKRGARSPDLADALGLTFADIFYIEHYTEFQKKKTYGPNDPPLPGMTNSSRGPVEPIDEFGPGGSTTAWMG